MANKGLKNKSVVTAWLCVALFLLTMGIGGAAIVASKGGIPAWGGIKPIPGPNSSSQGSSQGGSQMPDDKNSGNMQVDGNVVNAAEPPEEMRAVTLKAGREFPAEGTTEEIKAAIDSAVESAKELTMNTLVIDPATADKTVVYSAGQIPSVSFEAGFDPINYAVEKGKANGFYTMVTYYITDCNLSDTPQALQSLDATFLDTMTKDVKSFASSCKADAVILDGYYNVSPKDGYARYLKTGMGTGYTEYQRAAPNSMLSYAYKTFKTASPSLKVGIATEPVWANASQDDKGSDTKGDFSTLRDGNADTLDILDKQLCDFVAVKATGSTEDDKLPYTKVASWWAKETKERAIPLYIIHSADKAVTDNKGWSEYDQLARQVIEGRKQQGYNGSIFNSLTRLIENPKDCAAKLIGYYDGEVKEQHILTNLELTTPSKTTYTSFDPSVIFSGNTDPNTEATVNGVKIVVDKNGYFTLKMDLVEGPNRFEVVHKGKKIIYNITRVIEVVREVTPTGVINADGGTKMSITAEAYAEADVYAVINGKTIVMELVNESEDESLRNTSYRKFAATYTVPDATTAVQNIGAIVVYGEWNDIKKSKTGATIKINARALPSDGRPIVVTSEWAETFPSNTLSHYSEPTYFPLPKGALDYAVGNEIRYSINEDGKVKTYSFYKLESGLRVLTEDITTVSTANAPVGNRISGLTVVSDERHTKITLATKQQVSYTARYSPEAITIDFHYTDSVPEGMTLTKNPLFSSLSFKNSTMTLKLNSRGVFFGYAAYYDTAGNLVLRFNNPPPASGTNLNGTKIAIDPGHGGNDTGALGYLGTHPEKVVNWAIASKLNSILTSRGADVYQIPSQNYNYALPNRVKMVVDEDPHLLVSVHSNSSATTRTAAGSEAYYFTPFSYAFSTHAASRVSNALNTANRGGKFAYFYVTRNTQFPSILVETGFMSNQNEYSKLVNSEYQNNIATAIADAICAYFTTMGATPNIATGTQTSGTMNKAGSAPITTPNASTDDDVSDSVESNSQNGVKLSMSQDSLKLSMGDEETLWAEFEDGSTADIVWSATGDGKAIKIIPDKDSKDTVLIQALNPGKVVITATVKGKPTQTARCTVTVTE